jgi:stage III sporulation protein AH
MLTKKKKIIILSSMLLLLVVTGVLNIILSNNTDPSVPGASNQSNFFANYRSDRYALRAETILYLNSIISDPASTEQQISDAAARRMYLIELGEKELVVEAFIKAKGFTDCVITNSTGNIYVIVKEEGLTPQRMAIIYDIIVREFEVVDDSIIYITPMP